MSKKSDADSKRMVKKIIRENRTLGLLRLKELVAREAKNFAVDFDKDPNTKL
jgi:hypothetical protein